MKESDVTTENLIKYLSNETVDIAAEAIWSIRRIEEDRCDMSLKDMGGRAFTVWHEAKAALEATLFAAKPVAWQPRYKQDVIDRQGGELGEWAMSVYSNKVEAEGYGLGGHEVRPLYAEPFAGPANPPKDAE